MTVRTRFRLGISYVSLVVGGSLAATSVQAGDAVISTAQTSPAATSRADGVAPGNLTLAPEGSIKVGSGPAVTVDSSHSFTNHGTVEVTAESRALGLHVSTAVGAITGNVVDNGILNIPGPAQTSALWPEYVFNTGIEVSGANPFNGSITRGAGSTLTVGGNGATGIAILRTMNGSLTNDGTIKLGRQDSFGIKATGAISGGLSNGGAIEATGQEAIGIYAGGGVGGAIVNRGSISTGAPATTNAANEAVPAVRGGRALWVANDAGGIFLDGNGLTKQQETDSGVPDGAAADSLLSVRGSAEALFIGQGGLSGTQDIVIGRLAGNANGASVVSRGNIAVESAIKSTTPVRAVNITGTSASVRTTLEGGFRNEGGDITSFGRDSTAQAIRIGDYATVPSLFNSGLIHARGVDSGENAETGATGSGGGDAYAVIIEQGGRLPELINTGKIHADSRGFTQSAYGIVDYSGTLTSVVNDGNVIASVRGTGSAVALDLRNAAGGASLRNTGTFSGSMLFGAGADTVTSTGGIMLGNMSMGAGNDRVSLDSTTFTGTLDLGAGAHTVAFTNSTIEGALLLGEGATATVDINSSSVTIPTTSGVSFTYGHIRGGSTINFNINALEETVGGVKAAGNLVVDAGTTLKTTITGAVVDQFTVNLMEAGALTLGTDLAGLQPGSTVMYQREIKLADDNPNILQFQITRRTAAELGLSPTLGSIYDSSVAGLGLDSEFSGAMADFTDQAKFEAALAEMVPDTSDAARRVALTARSLSQSALSRRMSGFLSNRNDPLGRFRSGFWLQHLTSFGSGDGEGAVPGYSLFSMGVAGGVDAEIGDQSIIGISFAQTFGSAEEKDRNTGAVKLSTSSLDFYSRMNTDFGYLQGTLGYGFNSYNNDRTVEIEVGDTGDVRRDTGGSSPGYQWGATVDAGSHLVAGSTILTAYLRGAYQNIYRHAYEESGGGPAVDLRYDSRSYTSIRAGGGAMAERRIQFSASNSLALNAHANYAHEFNRTTTSVRARFVAGETPFELQGLTPASNIVSGGVGAAWERRLSTVSVDYDAEKAGGFFGHTIALTYRQRF